jgi:hypothetical protein
MPFSSSTLPGSNDKESCILALAASIWLKTDASISSGFTKPLTELLLENLISLTLVGWCKGMNVSKLRAN